MDHQEAETFVQRFQAAWTARDAELMRALWHENGQLLTPIVDRSVVSAELPQLVEAQLRMMPDLCWHLVDWAVRGDTVFIEWKVTQTIAGEPFEWSGMDRFLLKDGRILEERVYADTAPVRAMSSGDRKKAAAAARSGVSPDPMIRLGPRP